MRDSESRITVTDPLLHGNPNQSWVMGTVSHQSSCLDQHHLLQPIEMPMVSLCHCSHCVGLVRWGLDVREEPPASVLILERSFGPWCQPRVTNERTIKMRAVVCTVYR
jgi:hypothetical protein